MPSTAKRLRNQGPRRINRLPTGGFKLARIFGVEVFLDWSLVIIFGLIAINLALGVLPLWHPDWGQPLVWAVAIAAAILFLASILAHELSHAVVGRSQGMTINRITLFIFGGMAHLESEPASPRAEFLMAIIGPVVSVAIGMLALLGGMTLAGPGLNAQALAEDPQAVLQSLGVGATLLLWLGPVNVVLGLFNVVPGFPLDGGRVLRALLWGWTGDLTKATRWASLGGQMVSWTMMGIGVMLLFTGAFGNGIWLLLIGWFLNHAAQTSYQQLLVRKALEDVPVARLMRTHLDRVSPELPVDQLVSAHIMASDQQAFPVESQGALAGLVTIHDVRKCPPARWATTRVGDIMTPLAELETLPADAAAEQALDAFTRLDIEQVPVMEQGHVLGLVRRGDILKWLTLRQPGPWAESH